MLPRGFRLRRASDFKATVRSGQRKKAGHFVLYRREVDGGQAQVGFIVGKEVGNSVVRHRTTRRLRHAIAQLHNPPASSQTVIRCLPGAAGITYQQVVKQLASIW